MNIMSGQTGIKEEREDETQREEERFVIECDDAPQTVVSNCCLSRVFTAFLSFFSFHQFIICYITPEVYLQMTFFPCT